MARAYAHGGIVNAAGRYEVEGGELFVPASWLAVVRLFGIFWKRG